MTHTFVRRSLHKLSIIATVALWFLGAWSFIPAVAMATGPTFDATISGPQNGTQNVPTSANIHIGFTGNLNQSTVSTSNITLTNTTANTPVSISLRPFPNGFDITPSSPPAYAAGTSFSKLTTASTAFFFMQGTSTIVPQGTYTSPAAGDIVYFQNQSFPIQLGIVTNSTLTSGTFAINNFNLFGGQQITLVKTNPAATGAVSGTTAVTTGDFIVMNATANPTDMAYNWHLVTTGAAINSTNLRVDSAASNSPTFVSGSSFSTITPTATAAVDNASKLTLTLVAGDFVFANVSANADNLGKYAWHVVTTAEDIVGNAIPNTLRLDSNATGAPTFLASTRVSKLTPAAGPGLVTAATPPLSYGNIVFAKTTANASNNGSYNFHLITTPADSISNTALRFDNAASSLSPSTNYTVAVGTGLQDSSNAALASPISLSFTTGSNSGTNTTPPFVQSSTPQGGSTTFPIGVPITLQFSVPMATDAAAGTVTSSSNIGLFTNVNGAPGVAVTAVNAYNSSTNTVTITPSATLTAATSYIVKVFGSTKSSTGTFVAPYQLFFTTASGAADTTKPTVLGVFPSPGATGVVRPVGDISIGFSEDMNPATISATTITVAGITGTVTYNAQQRTAHFSPGVGLASNTTYTVTVGATVADLSGNLLGGNNSVANAASSAASNTAYVFNFTTVSAADDTVKPTIQFANADNFGIAVTFSEAMKSGGGPSAADNIANYTIESPVGTTVSLAGKTITYDGPTMTARITGLSLQNGLAFKVTGSNTLQDLAGNGISTALGPPVDNVSQGYGCGLYYDRWSAWSWRRSYADGRHDGYEPYPSDTYE